MRPINLLKLILWIVFFESVGFLLGQLTQANLYPWYESLNKSSLTPPGFVFSIVWSLLYALLAVIAFLLSGQNNNPSKSVKLLFAVQLFMNWAWTPLFFVLHWVTISAIWLVGLSLINLILLIKTKSSHKIIFLLLIPYFIWLLFASYLNLYIAFMN